jgi:hypothetical protein
MDNVNEFWRVYGDPSFHPTDQLLTRVPTAVPLPAVLIMTTE